MSVVAFFVAGIPQPQGSKTAYVRGGRAVVVDKNPALLKPWRAEVTRIARATWLDRAPLAGPVFLEASFVFEKPKTVRRDYPHVRPDVDKLLRAVMDGLTDAAVWGDDAQVCLSTIGKVYGDAPGVHIIVSQISAAPAV